VFDRFKNRSSSANGGSAATVEDDRPADDRTAVRPPATPGTTRETMREVRSRQREEFGGINWGAAFFGWLVAVGVAVLLTGLLAAAGAAIGLTETTSDAADSASPETLSVAGAVALLAVLAIAYYCGGYVAGRMSRFDGARQGIGAWLIGLLITLALAVLAVVAGSEYNVVERANLPRLPVGPETLTTGGIVASLAILAGTLMFAALGGVAGARYHHKVDRAGFVE
jgi:amino acid transporter